MTREPIVRRTRAAQAHGSRITLKMVAERAGVGQITASRVLREPAKVAPETRSRVLEAVEELGYIANQIASGLASGSSRVVPVIIPTLSHPVYVPFLDGVHAELDRHGYEVLLATTEYLPKTEARLVTALLGWFPAGLMMAGVDHLPTTRRRLVQAVQAGLPVVEIMDLASRPLDMNVGLSHRKVGEAVANYFADRGYRHIAYAGTMARLDHRSRRRVEGFQATLGRLGLPHHYDLRSDEPFSVPLGGRLLVELLEKFPKTQAIFFANDDLAVGAVLEARRRGIAVPQRVAIMGFNDLEMAGAMSPSISSVSVDQRGIGEIAARLLMRRLSGETLSETKIDVGFRIIERESSALKR